MRHIHTKLPDPLQLRKDILESALESGKAVQSAQALKAIDLDMVTFRKELKTMMKVLKSAASKLNQSLPPLPPEFKEEKPVTVKTASLPGPVPPIRRMPATYAPERNTFKDDLEEIRQKIKALEH